MADYCGPECYQPGGHHGPRKPKPEDKVTELEKRIRKLEAKFEKKRKGKSYEQGARGNR